MDVFYAGAGRAGSELLLAVAQCCVLRGSAPGGASSITFKPPISSSSLEVRQPGPRQLQAGEGEMKRTSKYTCSKQKVREAKRLHGCMQLLV